MVEDEHLHFSHSCLSRSPRSPWLVSISHSCLSRSPRSPWLVSIRLGEGSSLMIICGLILVIIVGFFPLETKCENKPKT